MGRTRHSSPTRRQFVLGISGALVGTACSTDDTGSAEAQGGTATTGGSPPATGGVPSATGGVQSATGGVQSATGGVQSATGGVPGTGGSPSASTGGSEARGGGGSGGTVTGGAPAGGTATALKKAASDQVILGSTGIRVSRLAMGSGSHSNDQANLGIEVFSSLLSYGHAQHGITFFETADAYGAHPHVAEAIRRVGRENVVVLTKTRSETAEGVEEDLARFREELGIDTIDIVLLHLKTSRNWTTQCSDAMGALARAKQSGAIRAHGVSCHSIEALRLAAAEPWVDVDLARINPAGYSMDSDPATVIPVLREMKAAGKGIIGMKILGEGRLANDLDRAIKHAVDLDAIDAFTIGFTSETQLDQVAGKISSV